MDEDSLVFIMVGDLTHGFHAVGPFATENDANAWADENLEDYIWQAVELFAPPTYNSVYLEDDSHTANDDDQITGGVE